MGKVYIYYNNDKDGILAAGIMYNFILDKDVFIDKDIVLCKMDEVNMLDSIKQIDFEVRDQVCFLGYPHIPYKDFASLFKRRVHENDIILIDNIKHRDIYLHHEVVGIKGVRLCISALTYWYLYEYFNKVGCLYPDSQSETFHRMTAIPEFLKFMDDHINNKKLYYPQSTYFYDGLELSDPKEDMIPSLLSEYSMWEIMKNIIQKGKEE